MINKYLWLSYIIIVSCTTNSLDQENVKYADLVIIGSGVAGLTAGIQAGRSSLKPLIIEGKNLGGGLSQAGSIGNWPGEINISGSDLMNKIRAHAQKNGCKFLTAQVINADFTSHPFSLFTDQNILIKEMMRSRSNLRIKRLLEYIVINLGHLILQRMILNSTS